MYIKKQEVMFSDLTPFHMDIGDCSQVIDGHDVAVDSLGGAEDFQTLYFQMDFKEHDTLPVGPEEDGDWWYANSRLGITVLTIYMWSATSKGVRESGKSESGGVRVSDHTQRE